MRLWIIYENILEVVKNYSRNPTIDLGTVFSANQMDRVNALNQSINQTDLNVPSLVRSDSTQTIKR